MAYINDIHILYYHIDMVRSTMLGCSYFIGLDYLIVHGWIRAIFLLSTKVILVGPQIYKYISFFPRVLRYFPYCMPCHHTIALLDLTKYFVGITFPILLFYTVCKSYHFHDNFIIVYSIIASGNNDTSIQ